MCDTTAIALGHRVADLFAITGALPAIDAPVLDPSAGGFAGHVVDSLNLVELAVILDQELGVLLHQDDLSPARSLREPATIVECRANREALANFQGRRVTAQR